MQLTIDIPDEQAQRLGLGREGLERLIGQLLRQMPNLAFVEEVTEFLGRGPQPGEIVTFHGSEKSQERVRELLDKNRAGGLTPEEEAELDGIESVNHLFALIKARAWQHLPAVVSQIPENLRELVRRRAGHRCEYCLIPEVFVSLHEPDHIAAVQHRGEASAENLALACFDCNRQKGPNLSSVDPKTGEIVTLFHPRRDKWSEHFLLDGARIVGRTAVGRATVELLLFNNPRRVLVRAELQRVGRYPRELQ